MRPRSHRRNPVVWSQSAGSAGSHGAPLPAVHTGKADPQVDPYRRAAHRRRPDALARAVRARWRPLLGGGVLTVVGVIWLDGPGGLVLPARTVASLVCPANPGQLQGGHVMRRPEVELERAVFSHPAQRRLAIQAMAAHEAVSGSPDGIKCRVQPGWHRLPC